MSIKPCRALGAVLVLTSLLTACGGGDDGDGGPGGGSSTSGICRAIAGNGATVTPTAATTATFTNPGSAFDGNLGSFAALKTTGGTGTSSIQGTLGSGSEPGGEAAGVYFTGSINSNTQVTITTYLKGTQQDTGAALTTTQRGTANFYGLKTTSGKNFDSIKATLALANDAAEIDIYELCVN